MSVQIAEVDGIFEETKLSCEDANEWQQEVRDESIYMNSGGRNVERGAPNNSGPQCIFAPDLVDTTSPEHRHVKSRIHALLESPEIDTCSEDPGSNPPDKQE